MSPSHIFSFSTSELESRRIINWNQKCFLHLYVFQDDIYPTAWTHLSGELRMSPIGKTNFHARYSIISVKRLISKMRQQNYSKLLFFEYDRDPSENLGSGPYFNALLKGIFIALEICLSSQTNLLCLEKSNEWKSFRSIHSMLLFMEDRFPQCNNILDVKISHLLHSETLIRTFRRQVRDVSFLHLLRFRFIESKNKEFSKHSSIEEKNILFYLLLNYHISEMESVLLSLWKRLIPTSQLKYFALRSDQNSIFQKDRGKLKFSLIPLNNDYLQVEGSCVHYGRYKNQFLLVFTGIEDLTDKWIFHILMVIQYYFHSRIHLRRINSKKLSTSSSLVLAYSLGIQSMSKKVQVLFVGESYGTSIISKGFLPKVPTLPLIRFMEKEGFRDSTGHPVSRSDWTLLTDSDISKRFVHLWKIFSRYYSGSRSRDGLRKLRYILRFSCDKTLACKHKSTIRLIRQKFDSGTFLKISPKNRGPHFLCYKESIKSNQRFRDLDIIQPVSLTSDTD
uniref:Maturase K n=2 Tax=Lygodium japonicum TaxID=13824 RepID=E0YE33_LYGJA|nr:intron maturase [Lygodium japonicum]ADG29008.1 maturase K [Lygodium japonicum]AGI51386.1 intron maturase [Lygodium japonicum]AHA59614.1 maturase K [Lygodium japonicum]